MDYQEAIETLQDIYDIAERRIEHDWHIEAEMCKSCPAAEKGKEKPAKPEEAE